MDYFSQFKEIYMEIFPEKDADMNLRSAGKKRAQKYINDSCQKLYSKTSSHLSLKLELLLNVAGKVLVLQPFYDGNSRVASTFVASFLKEEGYFIEEERIREEKLLPLFYSPNEHVDKSYISALQKRLVKLPHQRKDARQKHEDIEKETA